MSDEFIVNITSKVEHDSSENESDIFPASSTNDLVTTKVIHLSL